MFFLIIFLALKNNLIQGVFPRREYQGGDYGTEYFSYDLTQREKNVICFLKYRIP